jgi:predicted transposase YdaD
MGKKELTKYEALKLITPVVDDEVCQETRQVFFEFIENHDDVRKQYESAKKIKLLICSRCPCSKAPDTLRSSIKQLIRKRL